MGFISSPAVAPKIGGTFTGGATNSIVTVAAGPVFSQLAPVNNAVPFFGAAGAPATDAAFLFNAASGRLQIGGGVNPTELSLSILSFQLGSATVQAAAALTLQSNGGPASLNASNGTINFLGIAGATLLTLTAAAGTFTGGIVHGSATLISTSTNLTNNAAAAAATISNSPVAGNPTKWIPINDNGVTRNIPAW